MDPSTKVVLTLGPNVCKSYRLWDMGIPRDSLEVWAPLGAYPLLPCLSGAWALVWYVYVAMYGISWVYKNSRLEAHTKGASSGFWC